MKRLKRYLEERNVDDRSKEVLGHTTSRKEDKAMLRPLSRQNNFELL